MQISPHHRSMLPLIGLQGAVGSMGGFIGYFVVGSQNLHAMFRYTAGMLTAAMAATFLAYCFGPRFRLTGRRLFRIGFFFPGLLILASDGSVAALAIGYGAFLGVTWCARHSLEMSFLEDADRDRYSANSVAATIVLSVAATLAATLILAGSAEKSHYIYWLYGGLSVLGAVLLGRSLPHTEPVSLKDPLAVIRQPQFIACLPLFFLESGLFGITQAMGSVGAVKALSSASHFGWVTTLAGLVGGVALYLTRRSRDVANRVQWLGGACLVVGFAFVLLGASAWLPSLYIGYTVLRAAGMPFLSASEHVLNQRTLDIHGDLSDRIFARELVLWVLRMISLCVFWALAAVLSPSSLLVLGSAFLALATGMEYLIGKNLFWKGGAVAEQPA